MTEQECLLILTGVAGLGNIRIRKLIECFGSAKRVLSISSSELAAEGVIPASVVHHIVRFEKDKYLKEEEDQIKRHGVVIVSFQDEDYPENLCHIPDSPVILYVKGTLKKENNLAIAIVGSRRASIYGVSIAEKFAMGLSELGITIVSGMARGIDSAAHRGALRAKGSTVAVLGNGLSTIYPPENKKLFEEIVESGAVVSEFPMATPPLAHNFPRRNRIVSGLALGVVIAEASHKSGALITSRFALEQGREVFAVPGKVDSINAQGVNNLIKQGAKLISGIEDILEELTPQLKYRLELAKEDNMAKSSVGRDFIASRLTDEEANIYNRIREEAIYIDDVAYQSGLTAAQAMNVLLKLELKHLVRQLPGKLFVRT